MTNATVTVWVSEHDDPEVTFVINTRSDMESTFDDFLYEYEPSRVFRYEYEPSRVFRSVDPIAYDQEFQRYCLGWTELEMPIALFFSNDHDAQVKWVAQQLGAE